jgi:hypothetical protein
MRQPMGEASGGSHYFVNAMLAGALGAALYSGAFVWLASLKQLELFALAWMTPLFVLPLAVALFRSGRIGIVGALLLTGGITAAHFAALLAALASYAPGPIYATAAERAADAARAQLVSFKMGGVSSAVGAALSFAFIAMLAPGLRDRRRLSDYALATLALTALGTVVFVALSVRGGPVTPPEFALLLYVPWQLVFAFAIVSAFKDHHATAPASSVRASPTT